MALPLPCDITMKDVVFTKSTTNFWWHQCRTLSCIVLFLLQRKQMVKQTKTVKNLEKTLENLGGFKFQKKAEAHKLMPLTAAALDAMFPPAKLVCRYHVVGCRNRKM